MAVTISPGILQLMALLGACLFGATAAWVFHRARARRFNFLEQVTETVDNTLFLRLTPTGRIRRAPANTPLILGCRPRDCKGRDAALFFAEKEKWAQLLDEANRLLKSGTPFSLRESFVLIPDLGEPFSVNVMLFTERRPRNRLFLSVEDQRPAHKAEALLAAYQRSEENIFRHLNDREAEPRQNAFFNGGHIAVLHTPRPGEMAGDFIHLFRTDERICDLTLCDVKGEGFYAALLGASVRGDLNQVLMGLIQKENPPVLPAPHAIVSALKEISLERFRRIGAEGVICYARFNFAARRLDWASLGNASILHWRSAEKRVEILLGHDAGGPLKNGTIAFSSNDLFLLPSEMLFAVTDPAGERFNVARLAAILEEIAPQWNELPDPQEALKTRIMAFAETEELPPGCTAAFAVVSITPEEETIVRERIEIPFDFLPTDLPVMREAAFSLIAAADFPPMRDEMIYLALHEAMVNIIEQRDRQGFADLKGRFEALRYDASITWRFIHNLPFFMPIRIKNPKTDGTQDHGYGLFIIDQIADQVLYNRDADGLSRFEMLTLKESGGELGF